MNNPFEQINNRLNNIEEILLDLKHSALVGTKEKDLPLSIQQTAKLLHLSVPTVYGLVHRKKIPYNKRGKRLYFFRQELEDWIKK